MEVFKIIKFQSHISLFQLFNLSNRNHKYTLNQPKVKLDKTMQSFLYSTSAIWNNFIEKLLMPCDPQNGGLVIPGSMPNSDMSASIALIKSKLKQFLLKQQKSGHQILWE